MTINQVLLAISLWSILILISYTHSVWKNIFKCYKMLIKKKYWTNYNTVEFISWLTKSIIIIPGLIFGIQLWWLYFFTLFTSVTLIWASRKKALPTLVGFNTMWVWLSCMVLSQHLFK